MLSFRCSLLISFLVVGCASSAKEAQSTRSSHLEETCAAAKALGTAHVGPALGDEDAKTAAAGESVLGHFDAPAKPYNYLTWNCHNEANEGSSAEARIGVIQCQGNSKLTNADIMDMAKYHTANWRYIELCGSWYFETGNWGDVVGRVQLDAEPTGNAAPALAGDVADAVRAACGEQYSDPTLYDAGEKVEEPAPSVVLEWANAGHPFENKAACQQACTDRSNVTTTFGWDDPPLPEGAIGEYRDACLAEACNELFPNAGGDE